MVKEEVKHFALEQICLVCGKAIPEGGACVAIIRFPSWEADCWCARCWLLMLASAKAFLQETPQGAVDALISTVAGLQAEVNLLNEVGAHLKT